MPDPSATPGQQLPPEIAEIIRAQIAEQVQSQVTTRIGGFQRLISERDKSIGSLKDQLREQQLAALPPEEQVTFRQTELQTENERLRALLEIEALRAQYPLEAPFIATLVQADSAEAQFAAAKAFRESLLAPAPSGPAGGTPPAPGSIDPNRPSTPASPSSFQGDQPMDEAMANLLLEGSSRSTLAETRRSR